MVDSEEPVDELLTPRQVAEIFRVNPTTVTRWAKAGQLPAVTTVGGQRRYRTQDVQQLLTEIRAD